jgi:multidrug efflux system outer membrane protein
MHNAIASRDMAVSALSALIGRTPVEIMTDTVAKGMPLDKLSPPPVLPAGLPSDLLERRPDIRQAEHLLISSNYDIGAARALYFPSVSLTGLLGTGHPELESLFTNPSRMWMYGASVYLPLDIWRIYSQVEGTRASNRLAIAQYEKTVQQSFREIRDALTQQRQYAEITKSMTILVRDLRKAVELARTRYDNGYSAYLEVLDAERSLFDAEINLALAKSNQLNGMVKVCLALGGGWK